MTEDGDCVLPLGRHAVAAAGSQIVWFGTGELSKIF
jgi:hypothetical protein